MRYCFMIVLAFASISSADYLFDDQIYTGNIHGGTGCGGDFTLADAFVMEPSEGGTIQNIEWWCTGADVGDATSAWEISLYTDDGVSGYSAPLDTIWQKDLYPEITSISQVDGGSREAYYWYLTCDLNPADYIYLDGTSTYWLGIHYTGPEYGVYAAYSYPGGYYSYYYPGQPWYFMEGNLIFALSGTPGSASLDRCTWAGIKTLY